MCIMHRPHMSHNLVRTSPFYTSPLSRIPDPGWGSIMSGFSPLCIGESCDQGRHLQECSGARAGGTWLRVPQRVLFECFLAFFSPKNAKKHSKSTLWGTRCQVPKTLKKHSGGGHFPARAPEHSCKWRP